jgi:hypothetical protein
MATRPTIADNEATLREVAEAKGLTLVKVTRGYQFRETSHPYRELLPTEPLRTIAEVEE